MKDGRANRIRDWWSPLEKIAFAGNCAIGGVCAVVFVGLKIYIKITGNYDARWSGLLVILAVLPVWAAVWLMGVAGLFVNLKKEESFYVRAMNQLFPAAVLFTYLWRVFAG